MTRKGCLGAVAAVAALGLAGALALLAVYRVYPAWGADAALADYRAREGRATQSLAAALPADFGPTGPPRGRSDRDLRAGYRAARLKQLPFGSLILFVEYGSVPQPAAPAAPVEVVASYRTPLPAAAACARLADAFGGTATVVPAHGSCAVRPGAPRAGVHLGAQALPCVTAPDTLCIRVSAVEAR